MELEIKSLRSEVGENKRAVLDLGLETRDRRLALSGVPEKDKEDPITTAMDAVNKILTHALKKTKADAKTTSARPKFRTLKLVDIDNAYRAGQQKRKGPRTIIVAFSFTHIRQMVLSCKPYMKDLDVKYFLNEDLAQITRDYRANLKAIADGVKNLGHDTKVTGNKIIIDSETYQSDEVNAICPTILHAANREKILEDGIAFKGDRSIFSNFFPAPIIIDDVDYTSVEQFFQHVKAVQCGANTQARKIMSKSNPWYIKTVGSRVETNEAWKKSHVKTLYKGIFAKFEQNLPLRQALLNSRGLNLYEATTDLFYACGIDLDSPRWATKDWQGQNVTGKVLMKVRDEFFAEESLTESITDNTLLNLTSTDETTDEPPTPAAVDTIIEMEVGPQTTQDDPKIEDWPMPAETSATFADIVKSQSTTETVEISSTVPKLRRSLPQITKTPKLKVPANKQPDKKKSSSYREKLTDDDLSFLQNTNGTGSVAHIQSKNTTGKSSKKGKYRGKRRQRNIASNTSTPSKNFEYNPVHPSLSPQQTAALKYMGFHPGSDFAKGIAASLNKRK